MPNYNKSPQKWPGGKFTLLPRLFRTIPKSGSLLVEPFVGSAVFSINTDYDRYVLADLNHDVINFYKDIVQNKDKLLSTMLLLFNNHNNKPDYYELRRVFNSSSPSIEKSAIFGYLNRHGFKGLVRYSKKSGFNVPYYSYKKPYFPELEIESFSTKFKDAKIVQGGFTKVMSENLEAGSVCYCDPPYLPLSKTASFVNYTAEGFTPKDHVLLHQASIVGVGKGSDVFISNHDVPLLDSIYKDYDLIKRFRVKRSISAKAIKHKKAPEALICYYGK